MEAMSPFSPSKRRGFTLIELVVVLVILAVLAALSVPTAKTIVDTSRDRTLELTLGALHRHATALAVLDGRGGYLAQDLETAIGDLPGFLPGVAAAATWRLAGGTIAGIGELAYAIGPDTSVVGLAAVSPTGRSVYLQGWIDRAVTWVVADCAADAARAVEGSTSTCPDNAGTGDDGNSDDGAGDSNFEPGTIAWAGLGSGPVTPSELLVDPDGALYVVGQYSDSTVTFGAQSVTNPSNGTFSPVVAKADSDGTWQWAVTFGGGQPVYATAATLDRTGAVVIGGHSNIGSAAIEIDTAGGSTTIAAGSAYVAAVDPDDGSFLWALEQGGAGPFVPTAQVRDVAVAGDGSLYVLLHSAAAVNGVSSIGGSDLFLAKYSSGRTPLWTHRIGTDSYDSDVARIDVDVAGNVYVLGFSSGLSSVTIGDASGELASFTSSNGTYFPYWGKVSSDGVWQWLRGAAGGTGSSLKVVDIVADGAGAYLAGTTSSSSLTFPGPAGDDDQVVGANHAYVVRVDNSGQAQWQATLSGAMSRNFTRMVGGAGGVAVSGHWSGFGELSSTNISPTPEVLTSRSSSGNTISFNGRLDSSGSWRFVHAIGTSHETYTHAVAATADGFVFGGTTTTAAGIVWGSVAISNQPTFYGFVANDGTLP